MVSISEMTIDDLEDAIHVINAQEADLREQKRRLHTRLSKLLNDQRSGQSLFQTGIDAQMRAPSASADGS